MSSLPVGPWETSCNGGEGERMSEFLMGLLTGVAVTAGAIALGAWLMKQ